MWGHDNKSRQADVVAAFENQDDADEAVLQLRLAGFRDRQIGYTGQLPNGRTMDLLERGHGGAGAVLGGIVGAALGIALVPALTWLLTPSGGPLDSFGLSVTSAVFGALFVGSIGVWIGMSLPRRGVVAPTGHLGDGPFVLAVAAGAERDRAWTILHHHGHDLSSGAAPSAA